MIEENILLRVKNLRVYFESGAGLLKKSQAPIKAVDGVSFHIERSKAIGLVGESGSGKSTIGKAILGLVPVTSGEILYDGIALEKLSNQEFRPLRKRLQMIFQDPFNSLNPRLTVFQIIGEALEIHFPQFSRKDREDRVADLLKKVGLLAEHRFRYPHEFSGGQRQRIGIARALAVEPEFIVCDEPVSALDVSVQAQIINLLQDLQEEFQLTYLFIAHDLAVVEHLCSEVVVLYQGKIVEMGSREQLYAEPQHDYTKKLLAAVPTF
ncbi:MAG: ATP-binding cassette domain-containing protein [Verrucomicrobiae bacterium]|nr:ATP-binding cassette domain-containing protein [Verrucomicrobiae bacterium]